MTIAQRDVFSRLKRIKNINHWWVDGVCGYCIGSGSSKEEAISNAIKKINESEGNCVFDCMFQNRKREISYLKSLLNAHYKK